MSTAPPPTPKSDPSRRIYKIADFLQTFENVRPNPMYNGERFSCVTFQMTPGQVHEPHQHADVSQMWVIISGEGEAILDGGKRERVGPGTVIVHHPTQPHGIVALGPDDLVYINISERGGSPRSG
jgi:quercetin dioxygenase-like cupin family protein